MLRTENEPESQKMFTLAMIVVSVTALYLAAEVLMPLAMAILLSFVLAPVVARMERLGLHRVVSVLVAVSAVFALLFSMGWIVGNQMVSLASETTKYRDNVIARIQTLKRTETGPLSKLQRMITEFSGEITEPVPEKIERSAEKIARETERAAEAATADDSMARGPSPYDSPSRSERVASGGEMDPIPVRIVQPRFSPYSILTGIVPGAFGWLATAGIVIVFAIFMLLERDDLRNRLIRLIGSDQITTTTQALDDAAGRVSRYLRAQLLVNTFYGVMIAVALYFVGLPSALLLGLLGGLLRYIPYIGPWLGAMIGIVLAIAVSPANSWTIPLIVVGIYLAAELFINNVAEPVMYHSSTGISTIGILVAALFWTWLWGPVGLVLSTPLTVCIVVIGRYVPNFNFLSVMLSDDEGLKPGAQLYQLLVTRDEESTREFIEEYLKSHPLIELLEGVLLPTLEHAELDAHRDALDESRRQDILENIQDLVDELPELMPGSADKEEPAEPLPPATRAVVIVPARDLADEIAGQILALALHQKTIDASVLSNKLLFSETLEAITQLPSPLVVVSAVPPLAVRHSRNLIKRFRHRLQGVRILTGIWTSEPHSKRTDSRMSSAGADRLFHRLSDAIGAIERHAPARGRSGESASDKPAESAATS